jgi:hypothetical protein
MTTLDWNVQADANNIRPGSIELQRAVHQQWLDKIRSRPPEGWLKSKVLWRVRTIDKLGSGSADQFPARSLKSVPARRRARPSLPSAGR